MNKEKKMLLKRKNKKYTKTSNNNFNNMKPKFLKTAKN